MTHDIRQPSVPELRQLDSIRSATKRGAGKILKNWAKDVQFPESRTESIDNPAAYLSLRHQDLRGLQDDLSRRELSSLGRCESRVMLSLDAVLATLSRLDERGSETTPWPEPRLFNSGFQSIQNGAEVILGPSNASKVRTMVTMLATAASDPGWCREIIAAVCSLPEVMKALKVKIPVFFNEEIAKRSKLRQLKRPLAVVAKIETEQSARSTPGNIFLNPESRFLIP